MLHLSTQLPSSLIAKFIIHMLSLDLILQLRALGSWLLGGSSFELLIVDSVLIVVATVAVGLSFALARPSLCRRRLHRRAVVADGAVGAQLLLGRLFDLLVLLAVGAVSPHYVFGAYWFLMVPDGFCGVLWSLCISSI